LFCECLFFFKGDGIDILLIHLQYSVAYENHKLVG